MQMKYDMGTSPRPPKLNFGGYMERSPQSLKISTDPPTPHPRSRNTINSKSTPSSPEAEFLIKPQLYSESLAVNSPVIETIKPIITPPVAPGAMLNAYELTALCFYYIFMTIITVSIIFVVVYLYTL